MPLTSCPPERSPTAHLAKWAYTHHHPIHIIMIIIITIYMIIIPDFEPGLKLEGDVVDGEYCCCEYCYILITSTLIVVILITLIIIII
jgi:hypothetical protein